MGRDTGNLKSKQVEKLIRAGKPGKHYDGQGLRLEIKGPNNASWVARYQIDGVTRYMGLGSAKTFNLGRGAGALIASWSGRSWLTAWTRLRPVAPIAPQGRRKLLRL